ncbi:MAG: MBL fold metallo-hydrolase [Betaproteobacteria bacterium]|nr:MBL fold metallo-hydrolase [Betaproteobacteria bacterium]
MNHPLLRRLVCGFALCALVVTAARSADPKVVPVRVSKHAWYVQGQAGPANRANQGYNSNAGFVVTGEGVVVIDALGTIPLGRAFLAAIRAITDKPIRRVIVTHYHADHFYGLAPFKQAGAEIWAHKGAREYLESGEGAARLDQRRRDLAPWVDDQTTLIPPDRWLEGDASFALGGLNFDLVYMGPAHAPDDLVVIVREDQVLYSGDILFSGRIPFVGNADTRRWLATMEKLIALGPKTMVPGHGAVSRDPVAELALTRDYLRHLRATMGKAVEDLLSFEEAYKNADWSRYARMPAFEAANRINAYGTYLLMERESLEKK